MSSKDTLKAVDDFAAQYDEYVSKNGWVTPDVLFGLWYEFLTTDKAGHEKILDLGIGTGLCSSYFKKAGLEVHGLDGSKAMLEHCRSKNIAADLKLWDLEETPFPYENSQFDHVVAGAVFHILGKLETVFGEVARLTKPGGIFGFTVDGFATGEEGDGYDDPEGTGIRYRQREELEITVYRHSEEYIEKLLAKKGFEILKTLKFLAFVRPEGETVLFQAYIARKT